MKLRYLVLGCLLGCNAMAQTQIVQARDYVNSLLNQIGDSNGGQRFSGSSDYQRSGTELNRTIEKHLLRYQDIIQSLTMGSLAASIEQYNQLVRNNSLSQTERQDRLQSQMNVLRNQVKLAEASYRASLESLYEIEPGWMIVDQNVTEQEKRTNHCYYRIYTLLVSFADGKVLKDSYVARSASCGVSSVKASDPELEIKKMMNQRIQTRLRELCQSRLCQRNLMADYVYFYSSVRSQLDRELRIELADGQKISLSGTGRRYSELLDAVSNYTFENDAYRRLPESL